MRVDKQKIKIILEITDRGWVSEILLVADSDREAAIAEQTLARLTAATKWRWIKRLLRMERPALDHRCKCRQAAS
jgi:hypothetical protein